MSSTLAPAAGKSTAETNLAELKQRASILLARGDAEGAVELLDPAVEAETGDPELFALRGQARATVGQLSLAVEDLSAAVMLRPGDSALLDALGVHLQQLKMYDQAVMFHANAIKHAGEAEQPRLFVNLGRAMMGQGNNLAAVELFEAALSADPDQADAALNLSGALSALGQHARAVEVCRKAIGRRETSELWHNMGAALNRMPDRRADAAAAFERALQIDPDNRRSRHMLALLNGEEIAEIPAGFISQMFDDYASYYDKDVLDKLKYRVPGLIRRMLLDPRTGKFGYKAILDLGCGTGLVAVMLRDLTSYLKGVDLSRNMLAQALTKGLYDQIEVVDVSQSLGSDDRLYDAVVAGDVFGYVGRLEPVFGLIHAKLEPRGVLAFSVEKGEDGQDYAMLPSGRFTHGEAYVRAALAEAGFQVVGTVSEGLRVQAGQSVDGLIVLAQKP